MQSNIDSKLLERLRVGPLAPYLDVYLTRIEQDGFLPSSVPCQLYAIARFSKWLQQGGVPLEDIDEIRMRRFLDRDPGVVHYPEPASIRRLVLILRGMGVLKAEPPPVLTTIQRYVIEYRRYLVDQRGLSESCLKNYTSFVEQFLSERFGQNEPCFVELCASDVTTFVREQAEKLSPGRKKLLVTALRSFLRYLLHQGQTTVDLAGCVPAVACWSLSEIPKSLPAGTVQRVLRQQDRTTALGWCRYIRLLRTSFPIMPCSASSGFRTGRRRRSFLPGQVPIWTQARSDGPSTVYPGRLASGEPQPVTDRASMTSVTALPWRRCCGGIAAGRTSDAACRFCRPISVTAT